MEVYYQNAMQFYNTFILKLQYICCNVNFLDGVKLQYICSYFITLFFKDTFSCIVKLYCVLVINFHYIHCKITIEIFNSVIIVSFYAYKTRDSVWKLFSPLFYENLRPISVKRKLRKKSLY